MPRVTFDEHPLGTVDPFYESLNNTLYTFGATKDDTANPDSPSLSGSAFSFGGPIAFRFDRPVEMLTFDVGNIDNPGSVDILAYNANGTLIFYEVAESEGFNTIELMATDFGISHVVVHSTRSEPAGFGIDNLEFGDPFELVPPDLVLLDEASEDRSGFLDLGLIEKAHGTVISDSLGPDDQVDLFGFTATQASRVVFTITMDNQRNQFVEHTLEVKKGYHEIEVQDVVGYDFDQPYHLHVSSVFDNTSVERARAEQAGLDLGESLLKLSSVDALELANDIVRAGISNSDKAASFYKGLAKGLGPAAVLLDIFFRIDNVLDADDPARETFIQATDLIAGLLAVFGGAQAGAGIGVLFGGITAGVTGPVGGFTTGLVYSFVLSEEVQEAAGEFWDTEIEPTLIAQSNENESVSRSQEPIVATVFDEDWYLGTYADAAEAVASGKMATAYVHFLLEGAAAGYLPNEDASAVAVADLLGGGNARLERLDIRRGVFETELLSMSGDALSPEEDAVFEAIISLRRDSELRHHLDQYLNAIAHRKAMDLVHNMSEAPEVEALIRPQEWDAAWSNGKAFVDGLEDIDAEFAISLLVPNISNAVAFAVVSDETEPEAVLAAFRANAHAQSYLLNKDLNTLGVAEYGGVWVIVAMPGGMRTKVDFETVENTEPQIRVGTGFGDVLKLGTWQGELHGENGRDLLMGGKAADLLDGGQDNDRLFGEGGADTLFGASGDDVLDGGEGADYLNGGPGSDVIYVDDSGDRVVESRKWDGHDTVVSSVDFRMGRRHIEDLELVEDAVLGAGNGLSNTITGNAENNILDGGKNVDRLIGGTGNDTYLIRAPGDAAIELVGQGFDTVKAFRAYALDANVERLFLQTLRNDEGQGVAGVNGIGNDLDNTIVGNPFDNVIVGRGGRDTLKGQAGADTFVFDRAISASNVDRVIDFNTNSENEGDVLKIKGALFGGISAGGLAEGQLVFGVKALDGEDRFIFDAASGQLWFDPDGSGNAAKQLFATFENNAVLSHLDFEIF